MIKICSPQLGISPVSSLGGEVYDYQTLKGFTKVGWKVLTFLPRDKIYDKTLKNFEVDYAFLKWIWPPSIYSFLCLPYLFQIYQREKFDILRIHSPRYLGLAGLIFNFFHRNVPILISSVTVDDSKFFFLMEKAIFNKSALIIVQSKYMKKRLVKRYSLNAEKIEVTYGGQIEAQSFPRYIVKIKRFNTKDPVILFMGSLTDRKNPLFVFEVYQGCLKKIKNIKLVIIGQGPLKPELLKLVEQDKLEDQVLFIDSAFGSEKNYWFERADVVFVPSLDEGFGLIVTEAMSYGKPVITSDIEVFKEIINNGFDGYTLALNRKQQWVREALLLLKNKRVAKKIGLQAKKRMQSVFNWEKTYQLNKAAIMKILDNA